MKKTTAFVISHETDSSRTVKEQATSIIALTLTRALGRAGVKVIRVHPNHLDDSLYSRYSCATEICPDLYESEAELNNFLLRLNEKYPGEKVLIPASDDCSLYMAKHSAVLSKGFVLLNPTPDTMQRVKDKRRQYELATEVGVPIPETFFHKVTRKSLKLPRACKTTPTSLNRWRRRSGVYVNTQLCLVVRRRSR